MIILESRLTYQVLVKHNMLRSGEEPRRQLDAGGLELGALFVERNLGLRGRSYLNSYAGGEGCQR